jgi:hypothetical protein
VYDEDNIDLFFHALIEFILTWTDFKNYENMSEESRIKWREKLTILACYQFSPRKNYDISKNTIRRIVTDVIESNRVNADRTGSR